MASQMRLSPLFKGNVPVYVIPNPVNTQIFNAKNLTSLPRELLGRRYVFLPIARLSDPNKGAETITLLAEGLLKEGLLLVTAGNSNGNLLSSPNLLDLGFVASPNVMASLYRNAACTVLLSKIESFSMPVAESLCCGTPVAGFKAGGPESLFDPTMTLFVDQGNVTGLLKAILLVSQWKHQEDCGARFEPAAVASQYLKLYR